MNIEKKAKLYATKAHEGQKRKTTGVPMITHPIRVAETLKEAGFPDYVVAAGYLHDTVEDTHVTMEMILDEFGIAVAAVVKGNTENKDQSWEERKQHTIDSLVGSPLAIRALVVADKLDNLRCMVNDYNIYGEDLWTFFKRGREQQKWYFKSVEKNMLKGIQLNNTPEFFYEYSDIVNNFFKE